MNAPNPLDKFPLIRSSDMEEVCDAIGGVYTRPVLTSRTTAAVAAINNCRLRHISLAYGTYGAPTALEYPGADVCVQMFPISGAAEVGSGGTSHTLIPHASAVISPGAPYSVAYTSDYAHLVWRIDAKALTEKLATMTGETINQPLRMTLKQDFERPAARMLQQYLPVLINTLSQAQSPFPDWWIEQTEQFLMTMFLCGTRHNYSHLLEDAQALDAVPQEVRRAEEYIEANAQRPITLEELAEVAEVSAFSLFSAFRKHYGCSPLEFVRRIRSKGGGGR